STVGTMTELNDHLKLLFARAAALFCRCCGKPVRRDTAESIYEDLLHRAQSAGDPRLLLCFPVPVPLNFKEAEVRELLEKQGYTRFLESPADVKARAVALEPPPTQSSRSSWCSKWCRIGCVPARPSAAACSSLSKQPCVSARAG